MARPPLLAAAADSTRKSGVWAGSAFGLELEADLPVFGLDRREAGAGQPETHLRRATAESIDAAWSIAGSAPLVERRYADGRIMMTVETHPELGYRIDAPGHGRFRVAADGSLVECAPAPGPAWRWHRPFCAQALPLAAALTGKELLHASAVLLDGRPIAITGHSGAGKTSLAIHLVDRGGQLLADDVVALSAGASEPLAHPGVRFANVAEEQLESVPPGRRRRLGRVIGRSEKVHIVADPIIDGAAPLAALYFLERRSSTRVLEFERLAAPDPRELLAATFMPHITDPARMLAQLEVGSLIANRVPTFRLRVPPTVSAADLAAAVAAHARRTT